MFDLTVIDLIDIVWLLTSPDWGFKLYTRMNIEFLNLLKSP
jgi:hypothetical protein